MTAISRKAMRIGLGLLLCSTFNGAGAEPILTRVPNGGIQPQALNESNGALHLIYYKGDAKAGDLYYMMRPAGAAAFSNPIQINSTRGSAIAIGTIRGAQFALGRENRVHVAWNGSGAEGAAGMRYTRLNDNSATFEPERNLMTVTEGLDGGGSVAADQAGNVYVVWHGLDRTGPKGETNRAVFVAVSRDDGASFACEKRALPDRLGACACCGLKAYATDKGELFVLYRAARTDSQRDETLLVSNDGAKSFKDSFTHPWSVNTCPMSSAWLGMGASNHIIAGWETSGRSWFMDCSLPFTNPPRPISLTDSPGQKHPAAVSNAAGQMLFVWSEGTGWQKGGAIVWRVIDSQGKAIGGGRKDGLPVWSFPTAVARPDGTFEIFF